MPVNLDELPLPDELPLIPDGWRYESLGDIVEERGVSYGIVQPGSATTHGVPIVRVNNIRNGRIDTTDMLKVGADIEAKFQRSRLRGGEVLLTLVGTLGEVAIVPDTLRGWNVARAVGVIPVRKDPGSLWVSICLRTAFIQHCIRTWATTTVQATFNLRDLAKLPIPIPPTETREAIAAVLGALDDKIELNRRMNATLEAMARALFQSWFVDFDPVRAKLDGRQLASLAPDTADLFPAAFQDSSLGQIPLGWEVSKLKDLTSKIGSGATPRGGSEVYVDEGPALIRSQNVYDHEFQWAGLARLTNKSAVELKNVEVRKNDVLINITGDSILRTCVVDPAALPARVNQHVAIIRASKDIPPRYLHLYLVQDAMKSFLIGMSAGATRHAITKGHLESTDLLKPPTSVLAAFERLTTPWFDRIDSNRTQSRTLATVRDTLLPKLLSGELSVADVERSAGVAQA
jgi:type I restriction enzyme S subunit